MNTYLQIGTGLLPGAIVAVILLFKRKAFHISKIIFSLALLLCCGGMIFGGVKEMLSEGLPESQMSRKKTMSFANALAVEGAYDEAMEVIEAYSENYGYDNECRLLVARIELLDGDYESASGLYNYLASNTKVILDDAREIQLANASNNSADLVMLQYLESIGENIEEYGFTSASYDMLTESLQAEPDDIRRSIRRAIEDTYSISDTQQDCAETVYQISRSFAASSEDEKSSRKYKRAIAALEEDNGEMLSLTCVKKARIKAYVMAGEYAGITEKLNDNSSYHELMIAAELYMSGMVDESDFSENYRTLDEGDARLVRAQVDKVYRNVREDLSTLEKKNLKARIAAVSNQMDNAVLIALKEQLTDCSEEQSGTDKTKVCLELAKIEHYFGNETSTDNNLREAIYSSPECEDDSYVSAMSEIINVINNDENSENIKNVSDYVERVMEHSLTVDVEEIVSPQGQNYGEEAADTVDFEQTVVNYVSYAKSAISIGKIDTEDFSQITARVQISSDRLSSIKDIRNAVKIYDCGAEIKNFSLEKVNYTGSNIILVCDVSGSMNGSVQNLKNAVITFVNDKNAGEKLSVVTFSDMITATKPFGTSDADLISFAESMYAEGGTDMFSAVLNCLGGFPADKNKNNVLILMTDGQDNNPRSREDIYSEIGTLAAYGDVTIYTVGLGSAVDTSYLHDIADSGNGKFVYVSDSASLSSFYDMLHGQVNNQYELTYEALDTITMSGRTLEVALPEEGTRDVKNYSLGDADENDTGLEISKDLSIAGISPKYVYKGRQDTKVKLKGAGFDKDKAITVKLNGNIDYMLTAEYVDSETYLLTIPASIAVGSYNVEVTLDGKKKIFQNSFSVIEQGNEKKTVFGPYVFVSAERIENSADNYTLRGAVTLNGWLHFKGDVTLQGDLEQGGSITVSDHSGSYVEFDKATAEGIGKVLANKGVSLDIPALNTFKLYRDIQNLYDYDNYLVDDIPVGVLGIHQLVQFDRPYVRLYPNSVGVYFSTGTTILPYQNEILKAAGSKADMFKFSFDGSAQITDKNVGLVIDAEYGDPSSVYNRQINLLNSPVYFNGQCKVAINTLKNEYTLGAMVRLAFFAKESGLGAEIAWAGSLIPDSVKLSLELAQAVKLPTAFPIEVNDFSFQVSEINDAIEKGSFLSLKFTGSATFTSMSVKDYVPGISKIIGDVALLEMPDTTASIRVSPFQLEANATLNFLSEIKIAEADVKLGSFDYTNSLLQLDSVNVNGLCAKLKVGIMWDTADNRVSLELSGAGELDAHSRFVGVDMTGTAAYDFRWWILNSGGKVTGEFAVGMYTTHDGKQQFVFTYRTQDSRGKVKGKFYYIDENGKCGKNNGTLS